MGWFGGGKKEEEPTSSFASDGAGFTADTSHFAEPSQTSSYPPAGRGGNQHLQEVMAMEQQKAVMQQVISKLTETAFDQCIDRPGTSLTSREESCIFGTVGKYLDCSEFVIGRMSTKK